MKKELIWSSPYTAVEHTPCCFPSGCLKNKTKGLLAGEGQFTSKTPAGMQSRHVGHCKEAGSKSSLSAAPAGAAASSC